VLLLCRISGQMTAALIVYAATFMRYSLAVTPKNYLLFSCHLINFGAQSTQGYRFLNWHYWGGKEKAGTQGAIDTAKDKIEAAGEKVKAAVSK
jgi:mitochondrial pyruvate carrier 1